MLFQLVLITNFFKSELFSCLLKVDHVINHCKKPVDIITVIFSWVSLRKCFNRGSSIGFFFPVNLDSNFHSIPLYILIVLFGIPNPVFTLDSRVSPRGFNIDSLK